MTLTIAQPPCSQAWTGGYLYNKQISTLAGFRLIDLEAIDLPASIQNLAQAGSVLWDSLYLYDDNFQQAFLHLNQPFFLIHHLRSLDLSLSARERSYWRKKEDPLLASSAGLITTGHSICLELTRRFPKIAIDSCTPGLDQPALMLARQSRKAYLDQLQNGPLRILSAGHLIQRKGFIPGLQILQALSPGLQWEWLIVGDSQVEVEYAGKFRQVLSESGLSSQTHLLGPKKPEDVLMEMARADLFFFPSLFESYGMVVLEAIHVGLPVLAMKQGEMPQLISSPAHGLCYNGPDDLVTIRNWLGHRQQLQSYARNLLRQEEIPSWEKAAKNFLQLTRRLGLGS